MVFGPYRTHMLHVAQVLEQLIVKKHDNRNMVPAKSPFPDLSRIHTLHLVPAPLAPNFSSQSLRCGKLEPTSMATHVSSSQTW